MPTANIILYTSKELSDNTHPVVLRVSNGATRRYISLTKINRNLKCLPEQWNSESGLFRKNFNNSTKYNKILISKQKLANDIIDKFSEKNRPFSIDGFVEEFTGLKKGMTLFKAFQEKIDKLKNSNRSSGARLYQETLNIIKKYRNNKDIDFVDVNYEFLEKFEKFLYERGNKGNTVAFRMRYIRAILNEAISKKYMDSEWYPFRRNVHENKYDLSQHVEETKNRALEKHEVTVKIFNLDIKKHPELVDARNYFIFSYLGYGISFADIAMLKWKDIKQEGDSDRIYFKRKKLAHTKRASNKLIDFRISDEGWKIINYYSNMGSEYIFPILNENIHKSDEQIMNRIRKVRKKINKDLETIAGIVGIKEKITTYWARHTAASVLRDEDTPTSLISALLGHTSENTTRVYLNSFKSEKKDSAQDKLL